MRYFCLLILFITVGLLPALNPEQVAADVHSLLLQHLAPGDTLVLAPFTGPGAVDLQQLVQANETRSKVFVLADAEHMQQTADQAALQSDAFFGGDSVQAGHFIRANTIIYGQTEHTEKQRRFTLSGSDRVKIDIVQIAGNRLLATGTFVYPFTEKPPLWWWLAPVLLSTLLLLAADRLTRGMHRLWTFGLWVLLIALWSLYFFGG